MLFIEISSDKGLLTIKTRKKTIRFFYFEKCEQTSHLFALLTPKDMFCSRHCSKNEPAIKENHILIV